ncbi:MAG: putative copper-exporting P-type ATPase A [Methanomethylovorans sp. PtaU1.Bin093]|jgi:copper ion binding protein|uniref:heavy-metal-associated domain-containing protein n=1 Tax=Methanomethylovorans sp. PtaU1.Bin093 TaxID=1811679 RepID=UPI0009D305DC|nr:heavy-metal-associated domain-containing protein [Methanomethylovorans sp. PtaU1.Bin093]OPY21494.1 MAG: putative copper-exporting P-type ATPase A [Methanomethylovorans sp. PtaU1.Bin093]
MTQEIININGMMCGHCQATVEKAIKAVKGVKNVKVDLEKKQAAVEYDDAATDMSKIKKAVTDAGYEVVV